MKNVLYLRGTIDWANCNSCNYVDLNKRSIRYFASMDLNPDEFVQKINMWNSTFAVNYFQFRYKLNQIQKRNISQLNGIDLIIDWSNISLLNDLDDYLLLCVDDDDWFHQDVFKTLNNLPFQWDGVAWSMAWIGSTYCGPLNKISSNSCGVQIDETVQYSFFKTFTNNFAFKKSGYKKCSHIQGMLEKHWYVNNFCYKIDGFIYRPVDEFLSVAIKSPASITSLCKINSSHDLIDVVYKHSQMKTILEQKQISWAQEYYDEYHSIINLLQAKFYL